MSCEGSDIECQYELASYGISQKTLPIDSEGRLLVDKFLERLSQKRQEEASATTNDPSMIRPGKYDVLLGRGRPYQEYEGNLHLADIIDENRIRYQNGGRGQKSVIASKALAKTFSSARQARYYLFLYL